MQYRLVIGTLLKNKFQVLRRDCFGLGLGRLPSPHTYNLFPVLLDRPLGSCRNINSERTDGTDHLTSTRNNMWQLSFATSV